ncbi:hypothetical protein PHYBOEH_004908 [Phytophthora boehmeriae]|uniref:Uncharacterized protein n=1 Tax=Phytophthora boehmeriae TaxID=109152 RepID=A0A8T1X4S9_9STRA|nr:hypothetical protein PHYBOEH_004908 [Phytophthora boehmeriae]
MDTSSSAFGSGSGNHSTICIEATAGGAYRKHDPIFNTTSDTSPAWRASLLEVRALHQLIHQFASPQQLQRKMSMLIAPVTTPTAFDAALLELADSRRTIYENTRMSGENRHRRRVLPVDRSDSSTDALEADYAHNLALYFGETPSFHYHHHHHHTVSMPVSSAVMALDEALLLAAHSRHSIYEKTRLSGENRSAHHMLPTDHKAERTDNCSDATDRYYANAMTNYFVTKSASRL